MKGDAKRSVRAVVQTDELSFRIVWIVLLTERIGGRWGREGVDRRRIVGGGVKACHRRLFTSVRIQSVLYGADAVDGVGEWRRLDGEWAAVRAS